jgi:hypothetical protein
MKYFFRKKIFLIILAMYILAIAASFIIVIFFDKKQIKSASAGAGQNISGWAWDSQAGWISFNSTDCDANDDGLSDGSPPGCPNEINIIESNWNLSSPAAAIGADGLPVTFYYEGTWHNLKIAKCGDQSCSRNNIITNFDNSTLSTSTFNSIAIGADGLPVVSYLFYSGPSNYNLKVMKCGNASCSSGNVMTIVDSSSFIGFKNSIAIGADGLPIISYNYNDLTNGYLKILKCGNASCSSGNTINTIESFTSTSTNSSIAIGADDLPVVSYGTSGGGYLKVLKCGNASCGSGNTINTIVSGGNRLFYNNSIAIGADDLPVVSYAFYTFSPPSNLDLAILKCGNASCSSGNINTVVDSEGELGNNLSLAISRDGLPIVSYNRYDSSPFSRSLKVLKCGNDGCDSNNKITVVDIHENITSYYQFSSSLAIGVDGLPIISYLKPKAGPSKTDLKAMKCANDSCDLSIPNYGVNIDQDGNFSGYAWSSNAGWVSFYKSDSIANLPDDYAFNINCSNSCTALNNCTACYNLTNKNIYGWAKILRLGDNNGWLKLRKGAEAGSDYGVNIAGNGEFMGYAWNGNDNNIGLGWASFNCANDTSCATSNYKVRARIPTQPVIQSIVPDASFDSCHTLSVIWNSDVLYEDSFYLVRSDDGGGLYGSAGGACAGVLNQGVSSCLDNTLAPGQTAYYKVTAKNIFGEATSTAAFGQTNAVCEVAGGSGISGRGICPKTIRLTWSEPANQGGIDYYLVQRCRMDTSNCDEDSDYAEVTCVDYDPDTNHPTGEHCDDNNFIAEEITKKYKYRIAGVSGPDQGDWSEPSGAIRPCPQLPKWKEVKPE